MWHVSQRIVELLRQFNTSSSRLVLGAGAIHSAARLKSINARHLALASQCLGLVRALAPHVRAALLAQLPPKHHLLLVNLDEAVQDYAKHHEDILSKFVSIIDEMLTQCASSIADTTWDGGLAGGETNCLYITDVIKARAHGWTRATRTRHAHTCRCRERRGSL